MVELLFTYQLSVHCLSPEFLCHFTFCREKRNLQEKPAGNRCNLFFAASSLWLPIDCALKMHKWDYPSSFLPFSSTHSHHSGTGSRAPFDILQPGCRQQGISQPWTNLRLDHGVDALVWTSWNNATSVWGLKNYGPMSVDLFWISIYISQDTRQGGPLFCTFI